MYPGDLSTELLYLSSSYSPLSVCCGSVFMGQWIRQTFQLYLSAAPVHQSNSQSPWQPQRGQGVWFYVLQVHGVRRELYLVRYGVTLGPPRAPVSGYSSWVSVINRSYDFPTPSPANCKFINPINYPFYGVFFLSPPIWLPLSCFHAKKLVLRENSSIID